MRAIKFKTCTQAVLVCCCCLLGHFAGAQSVGIGTTTPHGSAILDLNSTSKGLLPPRMSTLSRTGIPAPAKGLLVFDTNSASYWYYGDGGWKELTAGGNHSDSIMLVGDPNPGPLTTYLVSDGSAFDTSGIIFDTGGEFGNYGNNEDYEFNIFSSNLFNALGVKVTIQQMTLENIQDTVIISSDFQKRYFTGNSAPQQFILNGTNLRVEFRSNGSVVAAGFKIRFDFIFPPVQQAGPTQISGWTYLPSKLAVRGGFDAGYGVAPDSIGVLSFGYGRSPLARGSYSVAMGNFAFATGYGSISLGAYTLASGDMSFASGLSSEAHGLQSVAMGNRNQANGNYAVALNYITRAHGHASFAANSNTQAFGTNSCSFGSFSRSHGTGSMAMGNNTESFGLYSVAMGRFTNAYGMQAVSMGAETNAIGVSAVATGNRSRATGNNSIATGHETVARSFASIAAGQYNDSIITADPDSWVATDPAFIIGNGSSATRRNAFIVTKEGRTGLNVANGLPQALLHLKGTLPSSYDSHIRLETPGASTDYASLVYDGDMKFRTFGAGDDYQWRNSTSNVRMTLTDAGNLSIAGVLTQNSDCRLKQNIQPLQGSLQKIIALGGYNYQWLDSSRGTNLQAGVLAQDVEKQMPELVVQDADGNKSVNYNGLIPYLIESVKELKKENDELRNEVRLLKQRGK